MLKFISSDSNGPFVLEVKGGIYANNKYDGESFKYQYWAHDTAPIEQDGVRVSPLLNLSALPFSIYQSMKSFPAASIYSNKELFGPIRFFPKNKLDRHILSAELPFTKAVAFLACSANNWAPIRPLVTSHVPRAAYGYGTLHVIRSHDPLSHLQIENLAANGSKKIHGKPVQSRKIHYDLKLERL